MGVPFILYNIPGIVIRNNQLETTMLLIKGAAAVALPFFLERFIVGGRGPFCFAVCTRTASLVVHGQAALNRPEARSKLFRFFFRCRCLGLRTGSLKVSRRFACCVSGRNNAVLDCIRIPGTGLGRSELSSLRSPLYGFQL